MSKYRPGQIVVWRNPNRPHKDAGGIVQLTTPSTEDYAPNDHWWCEVLSGTDTVMVFEGFIVGEAILPE